MLFHLCVNVFKHMYLCVYMYNFNIQTENRISGIKSMDGMCGFGAPNNHINHEILSLQLIYHYRYCMSLLILPKLISLSLEIYQKYFVLLMTLNLTISNHYLGTSYFHHQVFFWMTQDLKCPGSQKHQNWLSVRVVHKQSLNLCAELWRQFTLFIHWNGLKINPHHSYPLQFRYSSLSGKKGVGVENCV